MLGKLLITIDAIGLLFGAPIADINKTHLFNPRWPPHAKFVLFPCRFLFSAVACCAASPKDANPPAATQVP